MHSPDVSDGLDGRHAAEEMSSDPSSRFLFHIGLCGYSSACARRRPHRFLDDIKALTTPAMEGPWQWHQGIDSCPASDREAISQSGSRTGGCERIYLQPFSLITGAQLKGKNEFSVVTRRARSVN